MAFPIVAILGILANLAPSIMGIFASKSKITPVVQGLAPFIPKAMEAAQVMFGDQPGEIRAKAAQAMLGVVVEAGLAVSTGGQKHTFEDLNTALPVIQETFTEIIDVVKTYNDSLDKGIAEITTGSDRG